MDFSFARLRKAIDTSRADSKHGTLARLGETLLLTQNVERSLRFVTTFVIQKGKGGLDQAKLESQLAAEQEKTIGFFIAQLRYRLDIEPHMDERLSRFLQMRNILIHRLDDVDGWGLDDDASLAVSNDYLSDAQANCTFVYFWLAGLIKSWMDQSGFTTPQDNEEVIRTIERHFVPLAVWSIAPKT